MATSHYDPYWIRASAIAVDGTPVDLDLKGLRDKDIEVVCWQFREIPDPIGSGADVYVSTAEHIQKALQLRIARGMI